MASLAAFAIAFFVRPFGGVIFGPIGDRVGQLIHTTGSRMIPAYYLIAAAVIGVIALAGCLEHTGGPMRGDPRSAD